MKTVQDAINEFLDSAVTGVVRLIHGDAGADTKAFRQGVASFLDLHTDVGEKLNGVAEAARQQGYRAGKVEAEARIRRQTLAVTAAGTLALWQGGILTTGEAAGSLGITQAQLHERWKDYVHNYRNRREAGGQRHEVLDDCEAGEPLGETVEDAA